MKAALKKLPCRPFTSPFTPSRTALASPPFTQRTKAQTHLDATQTSEMEETLRCLAQTGISPSSVSSQSGGGYIALALHVMMVENGFTCIGGGTARSSSKGKFVPPDSWDRQYNDEEWLFEYRRKDLSNLIVLHLSLQKESKRLFVQGKELLASPPGYPSSPQSANRGGGAGSTGSFFKDRPFKTHNLGLQLPNYVQDPLVAQHASSWEKVFTNLDRCRGMFLDHVLVPLVTEAQKAPPREKTQWENFKDSIFGSEDGEVQAFDFKAAVSDPRFFLPAAGIAVAAASVIGYKLALRHAQSKE